MKQMLRKGRNMDESYMSTKEFCERLQISSSTVYRMINDGTIPAIKFGRHWKIPRSMFDGYGEHSRVYRQTTEGLRRIR